MDDIEKRLTELNDNKEFLSKLEKTQSKDEIIKVFANYGVTITKDELDRLINIAARDGELSEDDLTGVSGGNLNIFKLKLLIRIYKKLHLFNSGSFYKIKY